RSPCDDQEADGDSGSDRDERPSLPLRYLSADRQGCSRGGGRHGRTRCEMTHALDTHEFSRKSFLKGSGALALGLATGGVANASNNPTAVSRTHLGTLPGPPDPAQIDSWLQVNPDNTVTLFHGWTEMGQGSPTAIRQIAAEELGLSLDQVTAAQLDTNVSVQAFAAASSSTRTAILPTSMRGAAAAA